MSFELVCQGCGAMSGPGVGICPYCKTTLSTGDSGQSSSTSAFTKLYSEGKSEKALVAAEMILKKEGLDKVELPFLLTLVKLYIETDAPSSRSRNLLMQAHLKYSDNQEILDYLDLLEAMNNLKHGSHDGGELMLKAVIRRSPQNFHAHFLIGSHYFWVEKKATQAIPHLEFCVKARPQFIRAWGCLGALYHSLKKFDLANHAFRQCISLESNPKVKAYFEKMIQN